MSKDLKGPEDGGEHPVAVWSSYDFVPAALQPRPLDTHEINLVADDHDSFLDRSKHFKVASLETKILDIRKLFADGTSGPRHFENSGIVSWVADRPGGAFGRVVQPDSSLELARNFSCGTKIVLCKGIVNNDPVQITRQESGPLLLLLTCSEQNRPLRRIEVTLSTPSSLGQCEWYLDSSKNADLRAINDNRLISPQLNS